MSLRRPSSLLLGVCLVASQAVAAVGQQPSPPPWFGGHVQTDSFALTVPDDWVAVDARDDLTAQAQALAERYDAAIGRCGTACATAIHTWLQGEDESVRFIVQSLPADWADGPPYAVETCRIMGPESRQQHPSSELAGIVWDVFADSPGVEVDLLPSVMDHRHGEMYTFDFTAPMARKAGTVYVLGAGDEFAWLSCEASEPPADRWRSIADTFELVVGPSGEASSRDDAPELRAMLPVWVAGRPLKSYSMRGLDYLREWSRISDAELAELEADPEAVTERLPRGVELDDIELANAGRADPADPCSFATAFRIRGIPASMLPLAMVVDDADAGVWTEARFGDRLVRVGSTDMLDQAKRCGRPYVYDVGDVRFTVTTDDPAWAAEAIARLRPEAAIENASLLVSLPDGWRAGLSPSVGEERAARMYGAGMLAAAHDATKVSEWYVPTLEIEYTGSRLDTDVAATLDRWADTYPETSLHGRKLHSIERVQLPSGQALRLELTGMPEGAPTGIAEIRYLIAAPAGVFDLLFSTPADALPVYEAAFEAAAASFMTGDPDLEGPLARLARGELTRTEYELLTGGYTVVPEAMVPELATGPAGPVVAGGRIEVPARDLALRLPAGWHGFDLTHPDVTRVMERFDATSNAFRNGRLLPENALQRGRFEISSEGLGGFAMAAAEDLRDHGSSDAFDLVAVAPWDGTGAPDECVIYGWDTDGTSLEEESLMTEMGLRDSGYDITRTFSRLPAGQAVHIAGSNGSWQLSMSVLEHADRFVYLECGHRERHDDEWQAIADSLEFLSDSS